MLSLPFDASVASTILHRSQLEACSVLPEELALLSPAAVQKRRDEFILGREAARRSLARLAVPPVPILQGGHKSPLFPRGITGTISHAGDFAIAAVARTSTFASLGVDIELIQPDRITAVLKSIAFGGERGWLSADPHLLPLRATLLFSAKEAIFKSIYQFCGRYIDFDTVTVCEGQDDRLLFATIPPPLERLFAEHAGVAVVSPIEIRWIDHRSASDHYVISCVQIRRDQVKPTIQPQATAC